MKITIAVVALVLGVVGAILAQTPVQASATRPAQVAPQVSVKTAPLPEDTLYWKLRAIDQEMGLLQHQFLELSRQRDETLKAACVAAGAVDEKGHSIEGCNASWREKLVRWPVKPEAAQASGNGK